MEGGVYGEVLRRLKCKRVVWSIENTRCYKMKKKNR